MANIHEPLIVHVATQNILHDVARTKQGLILPQEMRIQAVADSILAAPIQPGIIGIQEAHEKSVQHNGHILADTLGYGPGHWALHNEKLHQKSKRGRAGEYVGLVGPLVDSTFEVDLGDSRKALVIEIAGVAFATFHWRAGVSIRSVAVRWRNANKLIQALEEYDNAVIFGDLNEIAMLVLARGRAALKSAGFQSVYSVSPATFPTPEYSHINGNHQFGIDDILVRGNINVLDAGVIEPQWNQKKLLEKYSNAALGPTDHYGLWASVQI